MQESSFKGNGGVREITSGEIANNGCTRTVWIRSHPATFDQVQASLQKAAAIVLAPIQTEPSYSDTNGMEGFFEVNDLGNEIVAYELIGPKATAVLQGVLSPVLNTDNPSAGSNSNKVRYSVWRSLDSFITHSSC
jgi:hypothetical protein